MSLTVCLGASTLPLIEAGGHTWFFLNWALGLKALGCELVWLETAPADADADALCRGIRALRSRLEPFGLADSLAVCTADGASLSAVVSAECLGMEAAVASDLLLNLGGKIAACHVQKFHHTAFVDIDPGLTQVWASESRQPLPVHDVYFTNGETVGTNRATFPDCGVEWHYAPACVYLPAWSPEAADDSAPYTTVSSWWGWWEKYGDETYNNEKRTTFLDYVEMPSRTTARLELALALWDHREHEDVQFLRERGWSVRHAFDVGATPVDYREYLQRSRGEFSCAKPSCMRLQNAWISDRSLCYMALGKPAVVQHTGPSRFLPDADGLFRFRDPDEAARAFAAAEADYEHHGRQARALVEEFFDAERCIGRVLERALP